MRIALTGAHSTGKSTLLYRLKQNPIFANYYAVDNIVRQLQKRNIPINEQGTDITQFHVIAAHVKSIKHENLILSRCILDVLCYTEYLKLKGRVSRVIYQHALYIFKKLIPRYDYLFYVRPEFGIVADGERSTSEEFQQKISELFEKNINLYKINVIQLKGSVEERYDQIIKRLRKDGKLH